MSQSKNRLQNETDFPNDEQKEEILNYIEAKMRPCRNNPALELLECEIFRILELALLTTLDKLNTEGSLERPKSSLDGLDYLCEYLYNKNPKHPERSKEWRKVFDIPFVMQSLRDKPRPYFPFSRIWSNDYAALKIQTFFRGYLVRKRDDVHEMRLFWKIMQEIKKC